MIYIYIYIYRLTNMKNYAIRKWHIYIYIYISSQKSEKSGNYKMICIYICHLKNIGTMQL